MPDPKNEDTTEQEAKPVAPEPEATETPPGTDAPTETTEAAPTETTEAAPTETTEAAPTETTEAAPTETTEAAPTETTEAAPTEPDPVDDRSDGGVTAKDAPPADDPAPADAETAVIPVMKPRERAETPTPPEQDTPAEQQHASAPSPADAPTVQIPTDAPKAQISADAPTVQIPVTAHTPKAPPQRITPRPPQPPRAEPPRIEPLPTPTRIPPSGNRGDTRWRLAAVIAGLAVVAAIVATAVIVFFQHRAENSPESRIRASVDTFVQSLTTGDLATLRSETCGPLGDFYRTVEPEEFRSVHQLAMEQGSIPVVTSIDKVQVTEDTAIAQVTAHPANDPADVTARTFDLAREGDEWKVCSE